MPDKPSREGDQPFGGGHHRQRMGDGERAVELAGTQQRLHFGAGSSKGHGRILLSLFIRWQVFSNPPNESGCLGL